MVTNVSSFRSRHFSVVPTELIHHLITFRLRQEWFALPIESVAKVILIDNIHGDPHDNGVGLAVYQGQDILVIDVAERIFGKAQVETPSSYMVENNQSQLCLLVVETKNGDIFGLPIDSLPVLRRVPQSCIKPLPEAYLAIGNIQCVTDMVVSMANQAPLFLLNADDLNDANQFLDVG